MARRDPRIAVVLIHGVRQRRPMDNLRDFVDAVWTRDPSVQHRYARAGVWSKPDQLSESLELRRLSTSKNRVGARLDFFELYWAHELRPATLTQVLRWMVRLLTRRVPPALAVCRALLLSALLVGAAGALNDALPPERRLVDVPWWLASAVVIAIWPLLRWVLQSVVGNATRYLEPSPENMETRHKIRALGIRLLSELHERAYDRIVVVGHSLGSVIAYDVLTHLWAQMHSDHGAPAGPTPKAPHALEVAAASEPFHAARYRAAQPSYARHLRALGNPWRVTDFITLGSPLTYAELLLARSREELAAKRADRELPTCPPQLEAGRFTYARGYRRPTGRAGRVQVPHHAALFAPVRWTNLYFRSRFVVWGDIIGGPLAAVFGAGVHDVPLRPAGLSGLFAHVAYWRLPAGGPTPRHVHALRAALDLGSLGPYAVPHEERGGRVGAQGVSAAQDGAL